MIILFYIKQHLILHYMLKFFYRGVPGKYRNRDIIDILNKPNIHGFWRGKGMGKKWIDPYAPGRAVQPNDDDFF
jgi:hypothetical protein